jgi:hypothetical protein
MSNRVKRRPEQQLQRAVLEHLAWRGVPNLWWCHVPNGGYRTAVEAAIFKSLGLIPGVPDLLLVYRGQTYGLELKTQGGRLSPTQIATHEWMRQAGAIVETANGIDEALACLELWQLLRLRRDTAGRATA